MRATSLKLLFGTILVILLISAHEAWAVKDAHGHKIMQDSVTAFQYDKHQAQIMSPKIVNIVSNGGTIVCAETVTPDRSCSGYGSNNMADTFQNTYFGYWDMFTDCGGSPCITAYWTSSSWPDYTEIGPTIYYWQYFTMQACYANGCSSPMVKYEDNTESHTVQIDYAPANIPLTIHASYYYRSNAGDWDQENIVQVLQKGYG